MRIVNFVYGRMGQETYLFMNMFYLQKYKLYYQFFRSEGYERAQAIKMASKLFNLHGYPEPSLIRTLTFDAAPAA